MIIGGTGQYGITLSKILIKKSLKLILHQDQIKKLDSVKKNIQK